MDELVTLIEKRIKNQWITFKNSIHVHKKLTYQLGDLFFQRISQNQLNFSHDLKLQPDIFKKSDS